MNHNALRFVAAMLAVATIEAMVITPTQSPVVILGPGSLDMRLLTAKLSAAAGFPTSIIAGAGAESLWWEQMYGEEYVPSDRAEGKVRLLSGGDERQSAFETATALCIVSDGAALTEAALDSVLSATPGVKRCVLMSKMGVTRATAGPLGLGKADVEQLEAEQRLRSACDSADIELSIVRVGTLKGGGPGNDEVGLARPYYDNIFDIDQLRVTQAYDKKTLGAACVAGDPYDLVNPLVRLGRKGSFEPADDETSRVVACAAVVAALRHSTSVEFSVSSATADNVPTSGQWEAILNSL